MEEIAADFKAEMPKILKAFGKTLEELTEFATNSDPIDYFKDPRNPDSFLNYFLDHPELELSKVQCWILMRWFIRLENPDCRFRVPDLYDQNRLALLNYGLNSALAEVRPEVKVRFYNRNPHGFSHALVCQRLQMEFKDFVK